MTLFEALMSDSPTFQVKGQTFNTPQGGNVTWKALRGGGVTIEHAPVKLAGNWLAKWFSRSGVTVSGSMTIKPDGTVYEVDGPGPFDKRGKL